MLTAKRLVDTEVKDELYVDILDHLAFTSAKLGDYGTALKYNIQLGRLRPHENRFKSNEAFYT